MMSLSERMVRQVRKEILRNTRDIDAVYGVSIENSLDYELHSKGRNIVLDADESLDDKCIIIDLKDSLPERLDLPQDGGRYHGNGVRIFYYKGEFSTLH